MSSARPLVRCQCPDANRRRTARETVARWSPSVVQRCRYAMSVLGPIATNCDPTCSVNSPTRLLGKLIEIVRPRCDNLSLSVAGGSAYGEASDALLVEAEAELVKEAMK